MPGPPPPSPEDFAREWGGDALVPLSTSPADLVLGAADRHFLTTAGLPALIRCRRGEAETRISFVRLAAGVTRLVDEPTVGPPLPPGWSDRWVIGDEFFSNGSAWWCVRPGSGRVERIDVELADPIQFANTGVARFAACALAARRWSAGLSPSPARWPAAVAGLHRELARLDPASMASGRHFWPLFLADGGEDGEPPGVVELGSRAEGERAARERSW